MTDLTEQFFVVDWLGNGSWVTPGASGWTPWPTWTGNTTGKLGHFNPGGDDQWEVQLELAGVGVVDVRRVQMDNTLNASLVAGDLNNRGDLQLSTAGACRVTPRPGQRARSSRGTPTSPRGRSLSTVVPAVRSRRLRSP